MKKMMYKALNYIRYKLCGSCLEGIEWENDGTSSLCYCTHDSYYRLIKQFIKRKTRRDNEPIFRYKESTS